MGVTAVADPVSLMLADLTSRYAEMSASDAFTRLYADDARFGHVFASLHERLNQNFDSINGRAKSTKHYWAESSRDMLALIEELDDALDSLKVAGFEVVFALEYRAAVGRCKPWLSMSGGSTVPEDFEQIRLIKFEPVFIRPDTTVRLNKRQSTVQLKMVGEGSYATVFAFIDPDYGIKFAVKRAKKRLGERDLQRFKQEFAVLKRLSFPYIVEVYQYDETTTSTRWSIAMRRSVTTLPGVTANCRSPRARGLPSSSSMASIISTVRDCSIETSAFRMSCSRCSTVRYW